MTDPLQAILQQAAKLETSLFPPTSRYHGINTATIKTKDGKKIIYLQRRFIPAMERYELIQEHTVTEGDRLDNIAAHYLGDPEQFWRIADANNAMRPQELTEEIGRKLRITQPEGISGAQYA
jgi:nucleoid-associated protein YgaU